MLCIPGFPNTNQLTTETHTVHEPDESIEMLSKAVNIDFIGETQGISCSVQDSRAACVRLSEFSPCYI